MPVTFRPLSRCSGPAVIAGLIGTLPTAALAAPDWHVAPESPLGTAGAVILLVLMGLTVLLLAGHAVRHGRLTLARLFGAPRSPVADVVSADWPPVTVLVMAHDDESVIEDTLVRLMDADYPAERLTVVPVDDRSIDRTRAVIEAVARRFPGRLRPLHRTAGLPGRAAALQDATRGIDTAFIVVIDAGCRPARGLIRHLMAPFFDPEVGAVTGRVVPSPGGVTLLARLLDLGRAGDHQVGRQAGLHLGLVPAQGGMVSALRLAALHAVGGWRDEPLAADADLACRLRLGGWTTIHADRAISQAADATRWSAHAHETARQARGRHQALSRHLARTLTTPTLPWHARLDSALQLGSHAMAPVLLAGWLLALLLYFTVAMDWITPALIVMAFTLHGAPGHFAAFFEIAAAARLDRSHHRVRLLAFHWLGTLVDAVAITRGLLAPTGRGPDTPGGGHPGGRP